MKIRLIPIALAIALLFSGCGNTDDNNNNSSKDSSGGDSAISSESGSSASVDTDFSQTAEDMFSNRDSETTYDSDSVKIQLNGTSASCSSDKVQIDGGKITITDEGTYILSGNLDDGMIIVDAEETDKPQLVFDNVTITSATSAPIYILEADKVFITLAEGSTNTLTNGGTFTAIDENNIDGVVFSKQDLTFNGSGSLTISAPAEHGIVCKDDLVFTGGTYTITSASHGIDANDSVRISDGILTIDAGKDGIHVENSDNAEKGFVYINGGTFNIDSADDGIHSNLSVYINNGTFTIASGDDGIHGEEELAITDGAVSITQSYEGLEALDITVSGGTIDIQSTDDGINAAGGTDSSGTGGRDQMFGGGMSGGMSANSDGSIVITGGDIFMYAQGDGLDANGFLEISGGTTIVTGPTQGDTAILDYDTSATITGGTFIGVGSTMMAQTFSDGTQGTMAVRASADGGTKIGITDSDGTELISYTPETAFACVIISTPDLEKGTSYTIFVGEQSGTFEAQ